MKEATTTWALVVGIDAYRDRQNVPTLHGAVRDAVEVVGWLRRLGVPEGQILLHAAPTDASKPEVDALGLDYAGCASEDIWPSFSTLSKNSGTRLFVFLSGHGLYEPLGARVFLTEEATDEVWSNLGIDWHARFLRGQNYARQFLFMDGCLNLPYTAAEREKFEPGHKSAKPLPAPRPDVQQWFCYAASAGQQAVEQPDGHGLFVHTLLGVLDLQKPNRYCADVDESTGAYQLDLNRAVVDVVAPIVVSQAAKQNRRQEPGIQMLSDGPTPARVPLVEIPASSVARMRVAVDPGEAAPDLTQLNLWSANTVWQRRLPVPPSTTVDVPYESVLPTGLKVAVSCEVRDDGKWVQPGLQQVTIQRDQDVVFRLKEEPPDEDVVTVKTVGSDGTVVPAVSGDAYDKVERLLKRRVGRGIGLLRFETGPALLGFTIGRFGGAGLAWQIAGLIAENTPADVGVAVQGPNLDKLTTAVRLRLTEGTARRLAGVLVDEPVIRVGEKSVSPGALVRDPLVEVSPGPVTVRVDLPWGSWVSPVIVHPGSTVPVALPRSVGVPPLRVRQLAPHYDDTDPPRCVVAVGRLPVSGAVLVAGEEAGTLAPLPTPPPTWRGQWSGTTAGGRPWTSVAAVTVGRRSLRFPLSEQGALAVQWGRTPRIEPLSVTPSTHWDRLVATARLDALDEMQAVGLTYDKWQAPLLGLAGAYACFAHRKYDYLHVVLENLGHVADYFGRPAPMPVDLPILIAAVELREDEPSPQGRTALVDWQANAAVPVFRWGVGLGIEVAKSLDLPGLVERWKRVDAGLVPTSAWTLWQEPATR